MHQWIVAGLSGNTVSSSKRCIWEICVGERIFMWKICERLLCNGKFRSIFWGVALYRLGCTRTIQQYIHFQYIPIYWTVTKKNIARVQLYYNNCCFFFHFSHFLLKYIIQFLVGNVHSGACLLYVDKSSFNQQDRLDTHHYRERERISYIL